MNNELMNMMIKDSHSINEQLMFCSSMTNEEKRRVAEKLLHNISSDVNLTPSTEHRFTKFMLEAYDLKEYQHSFIREWAQRFKEGIEWDFADNKAKKILEKIAPRLYGRVNTKKEGKVPKSKDKEKDIIKALTEDQVEDMREKISDFVQSDLKLLDSIYRNYINPETPRETDECIQEVSDFLEKATSDQLKEIWFKYVTWKSEVDEEEESQKVDAPEIEVKDKPKDMDKLTYLERKKAREARYDAIAPLETEDNYSDEDVTSTTDKLMSYAENLRDILNTQVWSESSLPLIANIVELAKKIHSQLEEPE